jgi:hypothetical protein
MVKFQFRIGRAFLDYRWHPITIPKAHYPRLEQEGLAQDSVSIESPFGSMPEFYCLLQSRIWSILSDQDGWWERTRSHERVQARTVHHC